MTSVNEGAGGGERLDIDSGPPRRLIVTIYGLYARDRGGWLSVAALVQLMSDVGIDGQAVRSAVSRLKRAGVLEADRRDGSAGYRLSGAGLDLLAEGDTRIFGRHRAGRDEGWLLLAFSVPESERDRRHQLRSLLTRLGLGTVAPGLWIAPAHLETEVTTALRRADLMGFTDLFRSRHVGGADRESVARWWDLDALQQQYSWFLERFEPVRTAWLDAPRPPAVAFHDYLALVTAWRRLPYLDPGLPLTSLPDGWCGLASEQLFADLQARLAGPALEHVNAVLSGMPAKRVS